MKGFFITKENAEQLDLLQNPETASLLQKTVIVITENDLEYECPEVELSQEKVDSLSLYFYRYYYQGLMETFMSSSEDESEEEEDDEI